MSTHQVGVDLHRAVAQVCVLDREGEVAEERRFPISDRVDGDALLTYLEQWKDKARYAVEAVGCDRWFVQGARARGMDVVVADPSKLGLRLSGKKTDRRDAQELARRLRLGDIDRSARTYFPTEAEFGLRKLQRIRHRLVQVRQILMCQVRAILDAYLVRAPTPSLWTRKGLEWLQGVRPGTGALAAGFQALVAALAGVQAQVRELDARLAEVRKERDVAALVQELPSVSTLTASTLVAELGDVTRFRSTRAVACYAGLAPRVLSSADTTHHGRITKQGNPELRWILCEWAVRLLRTHPQVRAWALPMYRRMHRNKVRIALARRLLVSVYVLLTRGEVFSMERCLATSA